MEDNRNGKILCIQCGLVKEDRFIDQHTEYRYFNDQSSQRGDPRRVGNHVSLHLDSQIDLIQIDDNKKNYHVFYSLSNSDKYFQKTQKIIKRFCYFLDLRENIMKQAEDIYYDVQNKKELKGKKLEIVAAASIYLACKRSFVNIQPNAFEPIIDTNYHKILKIAKFILKYIP